MAKFLSFKFLLDFIFAKTEHAQNAPVMKIIHVARFFLPSRKYSHSKHFWLYGNGLSLYTCK